MRVMKNYLLLNFLIVFSGQLLAKQVEVGKALSIAEKEIQLQQGIMKRQSMSGLQLAYTATKTSGIKKLNTGGESLACYYVFNIGNNGGFIIVSGDDIAAPVLGYSTEGSFNMDEMSPGFSFWLETVQGEISYALDNGIEQDEQTAGQWADYLSEGLPIRRAASVAPLLKTQWGQKAPFNDMCPLIGNTRALSGCVATAMAQIMKYYGAPESGAGSYGGIDFTKASYSWEDMRFDYGTKNGIENIIGTQKEKEAVATIMYHAGVSVDMGYGTDWSGAFNVAVPKALSTYFGYDKNFKYRSRFHYNDDDWVYTIKNEIGEGRPVLFGASDENGNGGHSYVCDGFDSSGKLHFNWGWDGRGDGYFVFSALNVLDYKFNKNQYIVTGLQLNKNGVEVPEVRLTEDLKLASNTLETGTSFSMKVKCGNVSYTAKKFVGYLGIALVEQDNDRVIYMQNGNPVIIGQSANTVSIGDIKQGEATFNCIVPDNIDKARKYSLRAVMKPSETNVWEVLGGKCIDVLPVNINVVVIPITNISMAASLQMNLDDEKTLSPVITPANATEKTLTWESSNKSVATVNNGVITAKAVGTTNIKALSKDGTRSAVCAVTVVNQKVPVTGVKINETIEGAVIGVSYPLTCTVLPNNAYNKKVTWTSSNSAVATVSSTDDTKAIVQIKGLGTVDITATSVDNPNYNHKITITVKSDISVTGVTLEDIPNNLEIGDSYQPKYTVLPASATNKAVTLECNDPSVAKIENGLLSIKGPGTATVTVTTVDGRKTASKSFNVNQKEGVNITGLSFYKVPEDLNVGDTYQLLYTVYPYAATNKEVFWTSSDASVATVNTSGILTVRSAGTVTITVTSAADKTKRNSQVITIKASNVDVPVTGLSFYKVPETLMVGDTYQLLYTVYPNAATNKSVTWSSSNTSVVTVSSSGLLTVKGAGTATVTVASTADPTKKNSQSITVKSALVSVTGLSFFKVPETLQVGDTYQLVYSVWPVNASNKSVYWESSNTAIMSVSNSGILTVKGAGTATITVASVDGNKKNSQIVTVGKTGLLGAYPGLEPQETEKVLVTAYPNPSNGLFTVKLSEAESCRITVSTMTGKVVIREVIADLENRIDMSNYPAGIYLITIDQNGNRQTIRIVIRP